MAVELSKSRGNLSELAQDLGVLAELTYRWRSGHLEKPEGSFTGHGNAISTPEEAEIAKLKKQLRCGDGAGHPKKSHQHLPNQVRYPQFSKGDGRYTDS